MSFTEKYIDFFKCIAEQHIHIGHDSGSNINSFFRINIEELLGDIHSDNNVKGDKVLLVLFNPSSTSKDSKANDTFERIEGGFMVIKKYEHENYDDEIAQMALCEETATDIKARIKAQSRAEDPDSPSSLFGQSINHVENVFSTHPYMSKDDNNYTGFIVYMNWLYPTNLCVDVDKWKDL